MVDVNPRGDNYIERESNHRYCVTIKRWLSYRFESCPDYKK